MESFSNIGYVAFLDVLGFSSRISGENVGNFLAEYMSCLQSAFATGETGGVEYVAFSDSIVLTTRDDSEASLQAILCRCSRALGLMLEKNIPLRGAIAHGSYFRRSHAGSVFVAGKSIIEAFRYEQRQDWIGIMLAPSVVKHVSDLKQKCSLPVNGPWSSETIQGLEHRLPWVAFLKEYSLIPFHTEKPDVFTNYEGFAVVPTGGSCAIREVFESLPRSMAALERMKSIAPDPLAQRKYGRTACFCQHCYTEWSSVVHHTGNK